MVRIGIERAPDGLIRGFRIRGHAASGPRGSDIVCAAVSVLSQTAILGLERRLGIQAGVVAGSGALGCCIPDGLDVGPALRAQDLLETMCLGLQAVAVAYPQHIILADPVAGVARRRRSSRPLRPVAGGAVGERELGAAHFHVAQGAHRSTEGDEGNDTHVDV